MLNVTYEPVSIPVTGFWGLLLMVMLLGFIATYQIRKPQQD
ncbi:MAG: hypothetical protein ABW104_16640 [Candidatus Thiodiazotropha sp. 6PLUC2]